MGNLAALGIVLVGAPACRALSHGRRRFPVQGHGKPVQGHGKPVQGHGKPVQGHGKPVPLHDPRPCETAPPSERRRAPAPRRLGYSLPGAQAWAWVCVCPSPGTRRGRPSGEAGDQETGTMPATIIMGGQWGDEGKGKLTDALAAAADMVVRANGGSNAGHTVATDAGVFKLHLVPSGILTPGCACVIGAGVVVDPTALIREMDQLAHRGVALDALRVSERAHLVLPYHRILDGLLDQQREDEGIGTTRQGIGPAYTDKAARRGLRVADLLDVGELRRKLAVV